MHNLPGQARWLLRPRDTMRLTRALAKGLDGASCLCRWARVRSLRVGRALQLNRPNSPQEWADLYPASDKVVTSLNSVLARTIAELTTEGDVLLEAGCGSGTLSAELATVGRVIELCDFSQPILDRAVKLFEASKLPVPRNSLGRSYGTTSLGRQCSGHRLE